MAKLNDAEITARLTGLPGWTRDGETLTKVYRFPTFPEGIAFVDRVAIAAETLGHHPDITINYNRVTMRLSTHDEGGVTGKDLALAAEIERAASA
jgi:4a-hydroxytetrahydrobiopterin dehydratase